MLTSQSPESAHLIRKCSPESMQQCTVHRKQYSVHSECSAHAHSQKSTLPKVLTALLSSHPHKSTLPNVLIAQWSLLTPPPLPKNALSKVFTPVKSARPKVLTLRKLLSSKCSPFQKCSSHFAHPPKSALLKVLTPLKNALPKGLTLKKVLIP